MVGKTYTHQTILRHPTRSLPLIPLRHRTTNIHKPQWLQSLPPRLINSLKSKHRIIMTNPLDILKIHFPRFRRCNSHSPGVALVDPTSNDALPSLSSLKPLEVMRERNEHTKYTPPHLQTLFYHHYHTRHNHSQPHSPIFPHQHPLSTPSVLLLSCAQEQLQW